MWWARKRRSNDTVPYPVGRPLYVPCQCHKCLGFDLRLCRNRDRRPDDRRENNPGDGQRCTLHQLFCADDQRSGQRTKDRRRHGQTTWFWHAVHAGRRTEGLLGHGLDRQRGRDQRYLRIRRNELHDLQRREQHRRDHRARKRPHRNKHQRHGYARRHQHRQHRLVCRQRQYDRNYRCRLAGRYGDHRGHIRAP